MHKAISGWPIFILAIIVTVVLFLTGHDSIAKPVILLSMIAAGLVEKSRHDHMKAHPELYPNKNKGWNSWKVLAVVFIGFIAGMAGVLSLGVYLHDHDPSANAQTATQNTSVYTDSDGNDWKVSDAPVSDDSIMLVSPSHKITVSLFSNCSAVVVEDDGQGMQMYNLKWGENEEGWNIMVQGKVLAVFPNSQLPFKTVCPID